MACRFLTGKSIRQCNAGNGIEVPSSGELSSFCENVKKKWSHCPTYRAKIRKDALPQDWKTTDLSGYIEFPLSA